MVSNSDKVEEDNTPRVILVGVTELRVRWEKVFDALDKAYLFEEMKMIYERLVVAARGDSRFLMDCEPIGENKFRCFYKPMAELVLEEVEAAATDLRLTTSDRKERIAEALEMAGF